MLPYYRVLTLDFSCIKLVLQQQFIDEASSYTGFGYVGGCSPLICICGPTIASTWNVVRMFIDPVYCTEGFALH